MLRDIFNQLLGLIYPEDASKLMLRGRVSQVNKIARGKSHSTSNEIARLYGARDPIPFSF